MFCFAFAPMLEGDVCMKNIADVDTHMVTKKGRRTRRTRGVGE